jgi:hypothetical protein
MPGFNQTGPLGQGPMSGRRMGRCVNVGQNAKQTNPTSQSDNENQPFPVGWGRQFETGMINRFGRGRCGRNSRCWDKKNRFGGR